jgi:hypothetical protein
MLGIKLENIMERVMSGIKKQRTSEKGNVLFLILIAVALFAALSYAVTQSTRSGSGTADKEQSMLSGATMTQYPTALRTSMIRMVLGGTDVSNIVFDSPAGFSGMSDVTLNLFHPTGGGAVFQRAPADVMANNSQGSWFFNANWDVPLIGVDGSGGNDIIAFLPGIAAGVCQNVNSEFAISTSGCANVTNGVPELDASTTDTNIRNNFVEGDAFPTADEEDLTSVGCTAFEGQPSGCFYDTDNSEYVFYSVLLER